MNTTQDVYHAKKAFYWGFLLVFVALFLLIFSNPVEAGLLDDEYSKPPTKEATKTQQTNTPQQSNPTVQPGPGSPGFEDPTTSSPSPSKNDSKNDYTQSQNDSAWDRGDDDGGGSGLGSGPSKNDSKNDYTQSQNDGGSDSGSDGGSGLGRQPQKSTSEIIDNRVEEESEKQKGFLGSLRDSLKSAAVSWYSRVLDSIPLISKKPEPKPTDLTSALGLETDVKSSYIRVIDPVSPGIVTGDSGTGQGIPVPERPTTRKIDPITKGDIEILVAAEILDENGFIDVVYSDGNGNLHLTRDQVDAGARITVEYNCENGDGGCSALPYGYLAGAGQPSGTYVVETPRSGSQIVGVSAKDKYGNQAAKYISVVVDGTPQSTDFRLDPDFLENRDTKVVKTEEVVSDYTDNWTRNDPGSSYSSRDNDAPGMTYGDPLTLNNGIGGLMPPNTSGKKYPDGSDIENYLRDLETDPDSGVKKSTGITPPAPEQPPASPVPPQPTKDVPKYVDTDGFLDSDGGANKVGGGFWGNTVGKLAEATRGIVQNILPIGPTTRPNNKPTERADTTPIVTDVEDLSRYTTYTSVNEDGETVFYRPSTPGSMISITKSNLAIAEKELADAIAAGGDERGINEARQKVNEIKNILDNPKGEIFSDADYTTADQLVVTAIGNSRAAVVAKSTDISLPPPPAKIYSIDELRTLTSGMTKEEMSAFFTDLILQGYASAESRNLIEGIQQEPWGIVTTDPKVPIYYPGLSPRDLARIAQATGLEIMTEAEADRVNDNPEAINLTPNPKPNERTTAADQFENMLANSRDIAQEKTEKCGGSCEGLVIGIGKDTTIRDDGRVQIQGWRNPATGEDIQPTYARHFPESDISEMTYWDYSHVTRMKGKDSGKVLSDEEFAALASEKASEVVPYRAYTEKKIEETNQPDASRSWFAQLDKGSESYRELAVAVTDVVRNSRLGQLLGMSPDPEPEAGFILSTKNDLAGQKYGSSYSGPKGAGVLNNAARRAAAISAGYDIPVVPLTEKQLDTVTILSYLEESWYSPEQTAETLRNRVLSTDFPADSVNDLLNGEFQPILDGKLDMENLDKEIEKYKKLPGWDSARARISGVFNAESIPTIGGATFFANGPLVTSDSWTRLSEKEKDKWKVLVSRDDTVTVRYPAGLGQHDYGVRSPDNIVPDFTPTDERKNANLDDYSYNVRPAGDDIRSGGFIPRIITSPISRLVSVFSNLTKGDDAAEAEQDVYVVQTLEEATEVNAMRKAELAAAEWEFTSQLSREQAPTAADAEIIDSEREIVEVVDRNTITAERNRGLAQHMFEVNLRAFLANDNPTEVEGQAIKEAADALKNAKDAEARVIIAGANDDLVGVKAAVAETKVESYVANHLAKASVSDTVKRTELYSGLYAMSNGKILSTPGDGRTDGTGRITRHHDGYDFGTSPGNPWIAAPTGGKIISSSNIGGGAGNTIVFVPDDPSVCDGATSCSFQIMHTELLEGIVVGERIEAGQIIGYTGGDQSTLWGLLTLLVEKEAGTALSPEERDQRAWDLREANGSMLTAEIQRKLDAAGLSNKYSGWNHVGSETISEPHAHVQVKVDGNLLRPDNNPSATHILDNIFGVKSGENITIGDELKSDGSIVSSIPKADQLRREVQLDPDEIAAIAATQITDNKLRTRAIENAEKAITLMNKADNLYEQGMVTSPNVYDPNYVSPYATEITELTTEAANLAETNNKLLEEFKMIDRTSGISPQSPPRTGIVGGIADAVTNGLGTLRDFFSGGSSSGGGAGSPSDDRRDDSGSDSPRGSDSGKGAEDNLVSVGVTDSKSGTILKEYNDLLSQLTPTQPVPNETLPEIVDDEDVVFTYIVSTKNEPTSAKTTLLAPNLNDRSYSYSLLADQLTDNDSANTIINNSADTKIIKAKANSFGIDEVESSSYQTRTSKNGLAEDKLIYTISTKDGDRVELQLPAVVDKETARITFANAGFVGDEYLQLISGADYTGEAKMEEEKSWFSRIWEIIKSTFTRDESPEEDYTNLPVEV